MGSSTSCCLFPQAQLVKLVSRLTLIFILPCFLTQMLFDGT
jgi:hypothetical protein